MTDAHTHAKAVSEAWAAWHSAKDGDPIDQAITAYLAAMRAQGRVMVPVVPTINMLLAAPARADQANEGSMYRGIYCAMVEAAMLKGDGDEQG